MQYKVKNNGSDARHPDSDQLSEIGFDYCNTGTSTTISCGR